MRRKQPPNAKSEPQFEQQAQRRVLFSPGCLSYTHTQACTHTHTHTPLLQRVCVLVTQSRPTLCDPMVCPRDFPGKNTGVDCHSLLQGTFLSQASNPGLPHCRQTPYPLSHQGSPTFVTSSTWKIYRTQKGEEGQCAQRTKAEPTGQPPGD